MKIKALSLWQPWASLIAEGAKKYETRSWKTNYRGPLLICAAKKPFNPKIYSHDFLRALSMNNVEAYRIPYGKALVIVNLVNCAPAAVVAAMLEPHGYEHLFGDFTAGRWAWAFENIRKIEPVPVIGHQGLFDIDLPEGIDV